MCVSKAYVMIAVQHCNLSWILNLSVLFLIFSDDYFIYKVICSCFVDYCCCSTWILQSVLLLSQFPRENIMEGENYTLSEFIILGFSDLNDVQLLFFTTFLMIYLCTLGGNIFIIWVTLVDIRLYTPMYFFFKESGLSWYLLYHH